MRPQALPTDTLLARAKQGDKDSCQALWERYDPYIRRLIAIQQCSGRVRRRVGISDISQEVWIEVFKWVRTSCPPTGGAFVAGLSTLVVRKLSRILRDLGRQLRNPDREQDLGTNSDFNRLEEGLASGDPSPSKQFLKDEFARELQEFLTTLPVKQRRALELMYFQDCTMEEISKRLGCSLGSVNGFVQRGRAAVLGWLEGRTENGHE